MQYVDLYLSSKEIIRLLNNNYNIMVVKDDDGVIYFDISPLPFYGPIPEKYLLYFSVDDYLDYDSDDEVIQYLEDFCYRIEDYNIKIV